MRVGPTISNLNPSRVRLFKLAAVLRQQPQSIQDATLSSLSRSRKPQEAQSQNRNATLFSFKIQVSYDPNFSESSAFGPGSGRALASLIELNQGAAFTERAAAKADAGFYPRNLRFPRCVGF